MTHPVPGSRMSAAYWQRGRHWSLDKWRDARGWGVHTGVDYAAPTGTPIRSATIGRVIAANAYDSAYGYKVIIRWGNFDVWYCHMPKDAATVRVGQLVEARQIIGAVGTSGNVTGAHLHMELRVAGGGFNVSSFRNPSRAVNYRPALIRWQSINIADDSVIGKATRNIRKGRLLTDILKAKADYDLFQEAPTSGGGIFKWMRTAVKDRPRGKGKREIAGGSGRRIMAGPKIKRHNRGTFTPAQRGPLGGRKPITWAYTTRGTYQRRLVINFHGPHSITYKRKVRYFTQVWAEADLLRKRFNLEWWQVTLGGDGNGPKAAREVAARYGMKDAYGLANKRTKGQGWGTLNKWKRKYIKSGRPDQFFFHPLVQVTDYRNVLPRRNRKKTRTLTDHNRLVVLTR